MADPVLDETLQDPQRRTPDPQAPPAAHVFLALACGEPLSGPSRHSLANIDEVEIGRGPERTVERTVQDGLRTLVLRFTDPRMSARHARMRRSGKAWLFEDLESTNGSRIDGVSVTTAALEDRALLELGHSVLLFRSELPTRADTAGDTTLADLRVESAAFATMIPALGAAFDTLARIAGSSVPVLLSGETGSGKEWLARAIHARSGRSGDFVAINCGAIPDTQVEAQLFGQVKGGFSGASRNETGYLRAAHQGTLFLDDVGAMPPSSQAALLRALEENAVVPVGTTRPVAIDLRVVAATHLPIDELARSSSLRNDVFARIAGFRFAAPPLRDRIEDLGLLVANVLREIAPDSMWKIEPQAAFALFSHDWPRNIRELKQCLAAAAVLGDNRSIQLAHVSQALGDARPSRRPSSIPQTPGLGPRSPEADERLRRDLIALFAECKGNVSEVARRMGKARVQIQRWLKRFSIDPAEFRD